jgi:hypothetical protein
MERKLIWYDGKEKDLIILRVVFVRQIAKYIETLKKFMNFMFFKNTKSGIKLIIFEKFNFRFCISQNYNKFKISLTNQNKK